MVQHHSNNNYVKTMSAIDISLSGDRKRGRSRTPRSGSARRRQMASVSRSVSRARSTQISRTWPMPMSWGNGLADPFPNKQFAIMRYSENITLDATVTTPSSYVFRANSIFDPNFTGIGHQPYGHDQYAAIYKYYRVKKAVITVSSASTGANNVLGVTHRATSTVISDDEHIREMKGTRFTALCNDPASRKVQMVSSLKESMNPSDQTAQFGTNPTDQTYFHVWTAPQGAAEPTALALLVDIVYYVDMWEPIALGVS